MRENEEIKIGDALQKMFRNLDLDDQMNAQRVIQAFHKLFGGSLSKQIVTSRFEKGTLFVQIQSDVLRQELFMNRKQMVKRLNEEVGANLVNKVMLR